LFSFFGTYNSNRYIIFPIRDISPFFVACVSSMSSHTFFEGGEVGENYSYDSIRNFIIAQGNFLLCNLQKHIKYTG